MKFVLRQLRAFWLMVGIAASFAALCSVTPAAARRMPPGERAEVSGRDAAPRAYEPRDHAEESIGRWPHRSAHRRPAGRAHRYMTRSDRHRARQARRQGVRQQDGRYLDRRSHLARRDMEIGQGGAEQGYATGGFGGSVVAEARRWLGGNPTNRHSLWCGTFMNFVLERTGHQGTGSDLARSFASIGHRVSGPQVGAIAVMARRGGGHVGVVSGVDGNGNPIIISGNHGRRVAESTYPRGRVYAYVMP